MAAQARAPPRRAAEESFFLFSSWPPEAHGVQGNLRIPFPRPLLVKAGSNLPEGQTLVGMYTYELVSGH